jgi:hypothetical protein
MGGKYVHIQLESVMQFDGSDEYDMKVIRLWFKSVGWGQVLWLKSVIPTIWTAEIRRTAV